MQITPTKLPEVTEIVADRFSDERGFFSETWNAKTWGKRNISLNFVQDNHSLSNKKGTVRGLHFQSPPHAQDKLVRVIVGSIYDVAVDIRVGSPRYGVWVGKKLSNKDGNQLLVPKGFLHGFLTLEDNTEVLYKCTDVYAPECDGAVKFDDPDIAVDWGMATDSMTASKKDAEAQPFKSFKSPFFYEG